MRNSIKTIAAATAIGATFATNAARADDVPAEFESLPRSSVFASFDCIEGAMRKTFGSESNITTDNEEGWVSAQRWIKGESIQADVFLGYQEAVSSLNVTITSGVASMADQNGELVITEIAPQGSASLYYDGETGTPNFTLQGYAQEPLAKYIDTMDKEIKSCAGGPSMAMM